MVLNTFGDFRKDERGRYACSGSLILLNSLLINKFKIHFHGVEHEEFNIYSQSLFIWQESGSKPGFVLLLKNFCP